MLQIKKRSQIVEKTTLVFVIITMIAAVWTWAIVLHHFNDRTICLRVPLKDYATQSAPAKCQQLWKEGKL